MKRLWGNIASVWYRFKAWIVSWCRAKLSGLNINFTISSSISITGKYIYAVECTVGNYLYETGYYRSEAWCYLKAYFRFRRYKRFANKFRCGMPIAVDILASKKDLLLRVNYTLYPKAYAANTFEDTAIYRAPFNAPASYTPVSFIGTLKKNSRVIVYRSCDCPDKWVFISHTYIDKHNRLKIVYGWVWDSRFEFVVDIDPFDQPHRLV